MNIDSSIHISVDAMVSKFSFLSHGLIKIWNLLPWAMNCCTNHSPCCNNLIFLQYNTCIVPNFLIVFVNTLHSCSHFLDQALRFIFYWRYMGLNIVKLVAKNTVSKSQSDIASCSIFVSLPARIFCVYFYCCFCFFSRYIYIFCVWCCCDGDSCYPSSSPPSLFSVVLLNLWLCIFETHSTM